MEKVTNEQILQHLQQMDGRLELLEKQFQFLTELIQEVRSDVASVKKEQIEMKGELKEIQAEQSSQDKRLNRIESKIDSIHVTWNHRLIGGTIGAGAIVSGIVAYIVVLVT